MRFVTQSGLVRRRRYPWVVMAIFTLVVMLGIQPGVASAADITESFDVNIAGGPTPTPTIETPTGLTPPDGCTYIGGLPPTGVSCDRVEHYVENAYELSGTVADTASADTGTIDITCAIDMTITMHVDVTLSGWTIDYTSFSGTGTQTCTWVIAMNGGADTLVGTASGPNAMELEPAPPATALWTGTLSVVATGGTGRFASQAGSGTFTESEIVSLPTTVPGHIGARPSADGSVMALALATSKPKVRFLEPTSGQKIKRRSKPVVRVLSAPGTRCLFRATRKGSKARRLGSASDGSTADGLVRFTKRWPRLLKTGRWVITARCTRGGVTSTGTVKVRIIR